MLGEQMKLNHSLSLEILLNARRLFWVNDLPQLGCFELAWNHFSYNQYFCPDIKINLFLYVCLFFFITFSFQIIKPSKIHNKNRIRTLGMLKSQTEVGRKKQNKLIYLPNRIYVSTNVLVCKSEQIIMNIQFLNIE